MTESSRFEFQRFRGFGKEPRRPSRRSTRNASAHADAICPDAGDCARIVEKRDGVKRSRTSISSIRGGLIGSQACLRKAREGPSRGVWGGAIVNRYHGYPPLESEVKASRNDRPVAGSVGLLWGGSHVVRYVLAE